MNTSSPNLPPPLIVAAAFLVAYGLHRVLPLHFLPGELNLIPALWLSIGGLVIFLTALRALRKAGTTFSPFATPTALVTTGPYRRSRNPIYLAFVWLYFGLGCWVNSWWVLLLFPVLVLAMNKYVIAREESVLETRFGEEYRSYRANTRRWA